MRVSAAEATRSHSVEKLIKEFEDLREKDLREIGDRTKNFETGCLKVLNFQHCAQRPILDG